jgi:hypothetical protein
MYGWVTSGIFDHFYVHIVLILFYRQIYDTLKSLSKYQRSAILSPFRVHKAFLSGLRQKSNA